MSVGSEGTVSYANNARTRMVRCEGGIFKDLEGWAPRRRLRRLRHANRWLIAGSAALTGVLTAVAASAFPGKTLKQTEAACPTFALLVE